MIVPRDRRARSKLKFDSASVYAESLFKSRGRELKESGLVRRTDEEEVKYGSRNESDSLGFVDHRSIVLFDRGERAGGNYACIRARGERVS